MSKWRSIFQMRDKKANAIHCVRSHYTSKSNHKIKFIVPYYYLLFEMGDGHISQLHSHRLIGLGAMMHVILDAHRSALHHFRSTLANCLQEMQCECASRYLCIAHISIVDGVHSIVFVQLIGTYSSKRFSFQWLELATPSLSSFNRLQSFCRSIVDNRPSIKWTFLVSENNYRLME